MSDLAGFFDGFLIGVDRDEHAALAPFLADQRLAARARVYRNTVFRGGVDALASAYPAVRRLCGEAYFETVAAAFVSMHPPRTRTLSRYGEAFPEFLAVAPGADAAPYLLDAARLDRAWLEAHTAADAAPIGAADLAALAPEAVARQRLRLHPSVRIAPLAWDVYDVWAANRSADGSEKQARAVFPAPNVALVWRKDGVVLHGPISFAESAFLQALNEGTELEVAAARALQRDPRCDISSVFAHALGAEILMQGESHD